jgi:hypothetical protein
MILDSFFAIANQLIQYIMSVRPVWNPPGSNEVSNFMIFLAQWDWILPIHETLICAASVTGLIVAMIAWKWIIKLADWVADIIP